jgi:hypothetical protein
MGMQYVVDEQGKPVRVLIDIGDYEELLERAEDSEAVAMLERLRGSKREHISLEDLAKSLNLHV